MTNEANHSTHELRKEYRGIVESFPELDRAGRKAAARYMCFSEAVYKGEVADFLYVPKLYTTGDCERFQEIATITYGILEKVINAYVDNPDYRRCFGFSKELEELILLDPGYNTTIPMIRIDIFYDEDTGDFKFCEFNTDGSSAMNEDREASTALTLTPSFEKFEAYCAHAGLSISNFELFESWVDTFLDIYASALRGEDNRSSAGSEPNNELSKLRRNRQANPNIVITDFMDISTPIEVERFAKHFKARGLRVEVCDIRDLRFDTDTAGEPVLRTPSGMPVDAVYRRAVTADIMKHYNQVTDFLDAYRAGVCVLIGSFRTQMPHTKLSFEVLHLPETLALLTEAEQAFVKAHVPYTLRLRSGMDLGILDEIITAKDRWIVKPLDSYGSKGVWAGRELEPAEWENLIHAGAEEESLIAQHYIEQYTAPNLESGFDLPAQKEPLEHGELPTIREYRDLTGLFVYAGQFKGLLARAGLQDRICAAAAGKCLGTFKVERGTD